MFWATTFSTAETNCKNKMDDIKQVNPSACEYLISRQPYTWCRAFFRSRTACEAIENGIPQCFNAIILEARKKPLIAMLEEVGLYMMGRFYNMLLKAKNRIQKFVQLQSRQWRSLDRTCS